MTTDPANGPTAQKGADEPEVELVLNQLELPDDFDAADLDELRVQAASAEVRTTVEVRPDGSPRDPFVAATLFVIHFVTQHGMEIALAIAEAGIWDGIKATFRRLRRVRDVPATARVGVTYPDGTTLVVEAGSADELVQIVRELGPMGASRTRA